MAARQKVFGLGYSLLVFVYDKTDGDVAAHGQPQNGAYALHRRTGDFTMTRRLQEMVKDGASREDIVAYLQGRNLPVDEIELGRIADEVLRSPPAQGYALQWRLQYGHAITAAGQVPGVADLTGRSA